MTVMGSPYHRRELRQDPHWPGQPPSWAEERLAGFCYLGAIVTGPVLPAMVYLVRRNSSQFVRGHAAQAINVALTCLLYAVSGTIIGVLLSFDSGGAALAVMIPIAAAGWGLMIWQLVRGASAAVNGEYLELPHWICSLFVDRGSPAS